MTKNLPALPNQDKRLAEVLRLHNIVMTSAAQMAVAAAMAGLEFKALKKEVGHGGWQDFFEAHFAKHGLSIRTAQNYMGLADGLKTKALKNESGLSFLALLDTAPSELKKADQVKLTKAVAKAADGAALFDLYQEMGIAKKPQGSGAKGGNKHKNDAPPKEIATAELMAEKARLDTQALITALEEALLDKPFHSASAADRKKLQGLLIDVSAALKETL